MTTYRSYFLKNNTLISTNKTNNAKNPVCEISYGTYDREKSRFLFDIDFNGLLNKLSDGSILQGNIISHTLNMTNTIRYSEEYVGKNSYSKSIHRASDFSLDLFEINEEWDEGSSYDFIYGENIVGFTEQASNWIESKQNNNWNITGAYEFSINNILSTMQFRSGSENINVDITNIINDKLFNSGYTYGFGLKFIDTTESGITSQREAVAFHTKYTNTCYEPYIETIVDDVITDDRNFFYQDKDNSLYLYLNNNVQNQDVTFNNVTIYDHEDNIYAVISGASIVNVSKGIYKIILNITSDIYPDAVIFRDVWNLTMNGKTFNVNNQFYLISADNYYGFNNDLDQINLSNYFFYLNGIKENEKISGTDIRKIKVSIKELYPNQNNFIPLDLEYRIFTTVGSDYELDIIPFTKVNRTNIDYSFNIDTSWLIPQNYKLQLRLRNGDYVENKQTMNFTVVSNSIFYSKL